MLRSSVFLLGVVLLARSANGQDAATSPPSPQRDSAAVAAVQQAINALGGSAAVSQIFDAKVTGTIIPANATSSLMGGSFVWDDAPPEFLDTLQTSTDTREFASGHGQPASEKNGVVSALPPYMAQASLPVHLPGIVLAQLLANQNCSIKWVGSTTVSGHAAVRVHMSVDTDAVSSLVTPEDWYLDAVTGLPLRVEYRAPESHHPNDFSVEADEFSKFQTVNGLQIPYQITFYEDGTLKGVAIINSVAFNVGLSSSEFDLLQEAQQ